MGERHPTKREHFLGVRIAVPLLSALERAADEERRTVSDVKLPSWFKIDTPIGSYNPDWAFVTEHEERLYFVRETKSTPDSEELKTKENQKIACGRKHFATIGVNYDVVTSLAEVTI
jgi:type III restriction enzyme